MEERQDLISRQAVLKHIEKIRQKAQMMDDTRRASIIMNGMYLCEKAVMNQPSVQPERKRGRWLPDNRPGGGFWVCSECKFPSEAFAANVLYKFCPNCGADMRGEQE